MSTNITDLMPTSIPTQNTHRLVVISADAQPDEFARLEITTADALAAARAGLSAAEDAPITDCALQSALRALRDLVAKGRILGVGFRDMAAEALQHLSRLEAQPFAELSRIRAALSEALSLSIRVSDLLAAEREVGWHRGIGRDH